MTFTHQTRLGRRRLAGLAAGAGALALLPALRPRPAEAEAATLTLVAYSTPREAYEALIPRFQATDAGRDVQFQTSFGASGDQSRAVAGGLPADVVAFSLAPDVTRFTGEGEAFVRWGAPLLSSTGAGVDFHTPDDVPARVTSPAALARVADVYLVAALAFLDAVGAA